MFVDADEEIDPIGDMDLRKDLFNMLYGDLHRHIKSARTKSVPSTFANFLTAYHRETVYHYEHRNM